MQEKNEENTDTQDSRLDLRGGWKQSYNLVLAMVVLLLSAFIMYLILR